MALSTGRTLAAINRVSRVEPIGASQFILSPGKASMHGKPERINGCPGRSGKI
jgi:hypothetical protein